MPKTVSELSREVDEMRTALAAVGGVTPDTAATTVNDPAPFAPGDVIHILRAVALYGDVQPRGRELEVTQALIDGTTDRNGKSALNDLVEKGIVGAGPFPSDRLKRWETPGDPTWSYEYLRARDRARSLIDPDDRKAAEAALHREYGNPPSDWREPMRPTRSKWAV